MRIALIALAALSFGAQAWSQEKLPDRWTGPIDIVDGESRPATVIVEGDRSDVVSPEFHLVRDNNAWQDLWRRHDETRKRAGMNPMHVDFATHMVVAVFLGRQRQVAGIDFYPLVLTDAKKHVIVRFRPQYYSFGGGF